MLSTPCHLCAIQAIHAAAVRKGTFFHLDEMIRLIEGAHHAGRGCGVSGVRGEKRPEMGHEVLVSNLWEVRDIWNWLAPGWSSGSKEEARSRAAFVSYDGLQRYRDFSMRLEASSTIDNPRVGLWAKAFMSDTQYEYVGTLTTLQLYNAVCQGENQLPKPMPLSQTKQKVTREEAVLRKFRQVMSGPYADQFSAARLADAVAMCKREWGHFSSSCGALPSDGSKQRMPHQLAEDMRRGGQRPRQQVSDLVAVSAASAASGVVGFDPASVPEPLQQRAHLLSRSLQFARAHNVQVVSGRTSGPRTMDEFRVSPVAAGSCVVTRPATKTRLNLLAPTGRELAFWTWRVLRVIDPGSPLPANSRHMAAADVAVFEAHLLAPADGSVTGPMKPVWDVQQETVFLRTPAEKKRHKKHKRKRGVSPKQRHDLCVAGGMDQSLSVGVGIGGMPIWWGGCMQRT